MSTLPKPRALLFDWDNTLVNTWPIIHNALHETFVAMGMEPWPIETTMSRVRKSMRDSFPEIFGPEWEKAGETYQRSYRSNHLNMLEALPGAEGVLQWAKERGLPSVIVSNKKGLNLRQEVAHLGWNYLFDGIVGSDDAARDKPHPDPVHLALETLKFPPSSAVWFIGDSDIDLHCAANTGCTPILFGPHAPTQKEFSESHYHGHPYAHFVTDHAALTRLLNAHS